MTIEACKSENEVKVSFKGIKIESQNEEESAFPEIVFEFGTLPKSKQRKRNKTPKKQSMDYVRSRFVGVVGFRRKGRHSDGGVVWYAQRNGKYNRCESEKAAALRSDQMAFELGLKRARLNFPEKLTTGILKNKANN